MQVKTDLQTMKEVYDLLSFYELTHVFETPFLSALASMKKVDILEEFLMLITGMNYPDCMKSLGGNHLAVLFGKFIKRTAFLEKQADMIFKQIESNNGNNNGGDLKNDNLYSDYCITLTKIGNFDPRLFNVADYAYILYKHNLEVKEENRKLEAIK